MKTSKYILIVTMLLGIPAALHAQWYNDGASTNAGGLVSDWTVQGTNTATGSYSTAGSTGTPSNYGVFEHRGQSGSGASAALVNNGSYDATVNGRDYFMGPNGATGQQEISGSSMPAFGELFLQNGATSQFDITNTNGIRVATNLFFGNGITTTVRANTSAGAIKFDDNATYFSTLPLDDTRHVNGYISKTGNDGFTFPVGSGSDVRTLAISAPASATDQYSAAWIVGNPDITGDPSNGNAMHSRAAVTSPVSSVSLAGQWDWIPVSGTGAGLTITVSIPDVSSTGVLAADLRLVGWNGTSWVDLSGGPTASGNTEGSTLSGTMIAGIQAVGIGATSVVLPVTFSSFTAKQQGCNAVLNWTTDMEHNNSYFAVERSLDGRNFNTIAQIAAAGNSTEKKFYTYTDSKPAAGLNQYRIKQVDIDGKHTATGVQALYFNCVEDGVKVYPNPATRTVNIEASEGSKIAVYNMIGQRIEVPATGSGRLSILDVSALAAGNYTIHIQDASGVSSHKLTVVK